MTGGARGANRQFRVRPRLVTWPRTWDIADGAGQPRYRARGTRFGFGPALRLWELADGERECLRIERRGVLWPTRYQLVQGRTPLGWVRKRSSLLIWTWVAVNSAGGERLKAVGDFDEPDYRFQRGDEPVARVSRRLFSLGGTYGIAIDDPGFHPLLILGAVLAIQIMHPEDEPSAGEGDEADDDD